MLTNSCRFNFCWLLWKHYLTKYFNWLTFFCCLPMCQLYFCWLVYPRKADSSCEDGVVKVHEVLWFHKWTLSPVKEGHALRGSVSTAPLHSFHQNKTCEKTGTDRCARKGSDETQKHCSIYPVHTLFLSCPLTHKCYCYSSRVHVLII